MTDQTQTNPRPARRRTLFLILMAILLLLALGFVTLTGCSTVVEPRADLVAAMSAEPPAAGFAHDDLEAVLERFVDSDGNVDYAALKADRDTLERYYARLASVSPDSHPDRFGAQDAALAYWLNAYNGCVLLSVTRLYPLGTVRDVAPPWFQFYLPAGGGFFYSRHHVLGGNELSLYALENDVVRERFKDPRIHFALNCASAGCPRLPQHPFTARNLEADLDRETRRFFAEPRNLSIDHGARTVRLSQILEWYESDFTDWLRTQGTSPPSLLQYAARYAPPDTAEDLRGRAADYALAFIPYDWRLNDRGMRR